MDKKGDDIRHPSGIHTSFIKAGPFARSQGEPLAAFVECSYSGRFRFWGFGCRELDACVFLILSSCDSSHLSERAQSLGQMGR